MLATLDIIFICRYIFRFAISINTHIAYIRKKIYHAVMPGKITWQLITLRNYAGKKNTLEVCRPLFGKYQLPGLTQPLTCLILLEIYYPIISR